MGIRATIRVRHDLGFGGNYAPKTVTTEDCLTAVEVMGHIVERFPLRHHVPASPKGGEAYWPTVRVSMSNAWGIIVECGITERQAAQRRGEPTDGCAAGVHLDAVIGFEGGGNVTDALFADLIDELRAILPAEQIKVERNADGSIKMPSRRLWSRGLNGAATAGVPVDEDAADRVGKALTPPVLILADLDGWVQSEGARRYSVALPCGGTASVHERRPDSIGLVYWNVHARNEGGDYCLHGKGLGTDWAYLTHRLQALLAEAGHGDESGWVRLS